jgi:hypothetical protein
MPSPAHPSGSRRRSARTCVAWGPGGTHHLPRSPAPRSRGSAAPGSRLRLWSQSQVSGHHVRKGWRETGPTSIRMRTCVDQAKSHHLSRLHRQRRLVLAVDRVVVLGGPVEGRGDCTQESIYIMKDSLSSEHGALSMPQQFLRVPDPRPSECIRPRVLSAVPSGSRPLWLTCDAYKKFRAVPARRPLISAHQTDSDINSNDIMTYESAPFPRAYICF